MIQSLNQEINLTEVDAMMSELEERIELSCSGAACGTDAVQACGGKVCGVYAGLCGGVFCPIFV